MGALRAIGKEYECDFFISDMLKESYTQSWKRPVLNLPGYYAQVRLTI